MIEIIDRKEPLASCYFCDNDEIAIGAIRAFKERGIENYLKIFQSLVLITCLIHHM